MQEENVPFPDEAKEKGLQLITETERELRSERKNIQNTQRNLDDSQSELNKKLTELKSKEEKLIIELEKSKEEKWLASGTAQMQSK